MARTYGGAYGAEEPERKPVPQGLDLGDLDEVEIKAIIGRELDQALGRDGGDLSTERLQALEYYNGSPLGTEVEGRSTVVMRSVLEAIEWVLPALLRIFTASDKIANVEPQRPEGEAAAEQATDYLTHIFYRDNPGFQILHDWFKDALLSKLGWVKYWWDTQRIVETNTYTGLTREQYDAQTADPDVTVVKEHAYPETEADREVMPPSGPVMPPQGPMQAMPGMPGGIMPMMPMPMPGMPGGVAPPARPPPPPMLYDVTLRKVREEGRVHIENVPPEEILFSRHAKRGTPIPFLAHRRQWTKSDLLQQGYDEDCLDEVPSDDTPSHNSERVARHHDSDYPSDGRTDALQEIWVEECYLWLAPGDDGAELYKVVTAGNGAVILTRDGEPDIECVDEVPFIEITPVPMPHKLAGMSLADLVVDIQMIKSTLLRQMLDNIYLTNNPRTIVGSRAVGEDTYDDIMHSRPGGLIRAEDESAIVSLTTPFMAEKAFLLVEYLDQTQEVRTGVARHNQGLNPDDLNKTATGVSLIQQAAAQRVELFARIFAIGLERLVRGILGLVRRHQQQERIIRVTGQWLTVDPAQWDEMSVTVSVGLGTGNRDQVLQHLMQILTIQQQIVTMQQGVAGPLVYPPHIYHALSKLTTNAGFKDAFFADPTKPPDPRMAGPPQPPKPDPAALKAQAEIQAIQAKAQVDVQTAQMKAEVTAQMAQAKAALEMQLEQVRAASRLDVEEAQAQGDMLVARLKAENEMAVEQLKAENQAQIAAMEIEAKRRAGAYDGPGPRGPRGNGGIR